MVHDRSPSSDSGDHERFIQPADHTAAASSDQATSPVSPSFQTPPIRSAALKSMFPDEITRVRHYYQNSQIQFHHFFISLKEMKAVFWPRQCTVATCLPPEGAMSVLLSTQKWLRSASNAEALYRDVPALDAHGQTITIAQNVTNVGLLYHPLLPNGW